MMKWKTFQSTTVLKLTCPQQVQLGSSSTEPIRERAPILISNLKLRKLPPLKRSLMKSFLPEGSMCKRPSIWLLSQSKLKIRRLMNKGKASSRIKTDSQMHLPNTTISLLYLSFRSIQFKNLACQLLESKWLISKWKNITSMLELIATLILSKASMH